MSKPEQFNFTVNLKTNEAGAMVCVDPVALYGYWERQDGSEGGGLWFDAPCAGKTELTDFDGAYELPQRVVKALRDAGFIVGEEFDA